jgi:HEAT repeat protein
MAVFPQLLGLAEAKQTWFLEITGITALTLLVLNVALIVVVHAGRLRRRFRGGRARRFRVRVEEMLRELDQEDVARDPGWLGKRVGEFDELQRPIAAVMLIERLRPASEEERERTLEVLREAGAVDLIVRSSGRRLPWRRALAVRALGWLGAEEAVPVLLERLSDRNRYVRESAVRALGRIGDDRALPYLGDLHRSPGSVGPGVVYDALIEFGSAVEPVFAGALRSALESVRVASCFGVAAVAAPNEARPLLEPLLADGSARVRAAAAESLAQVGGGLIPEALARASRDQEQAVRAAAVGALGSFDDPRAVDYALNALLDPDRDTAVRAGESLVRLSRRPNAGPAAAAALQRSRPAWPVERALTFASLGVV